MSSPEFSLLRLHVVADSDPGTLIRVLERFQNLNISPRRVIAEAAAVGTQHIEIEIDIGDLPPQTLTLITAKLRQCIFVQNAHWHPV
jgi:hypothetical protein